MEGIGHEIMDIAIRIFESKDLVKLDYWVKKTKAEQYMSRFYPKRFDGLVTNDPERLAWYVISVDGQEVGTVWLEKERVEDDTATLGIIIGEAQLLGKGIGRKTIMLAIRESRKQLGIHKVELNVRQSNIRAVACYEKCDFVIVDNGQKQGNDGKVVEYFKMRCSRFD